MKNTIRIILKISLVILWMILVFYFSSQIVQDSTQLSGGITEIILKIFKLRDIETISRTQLENIIRKLAHYLLYTLGGILIFIFVNLHKTDLSKKVVISWIVGTVYAITDEIHQLFVIGRYGEILDVCIDSLGVITGITITLLLIINIEKKKVGSHRKE